MARRTVGATRNALARLILFGLLLGLKEGIDGLGPVGGDLHVYLYDFRRDLPAPDGLLSPGSAAVGVVLAMILYKLLTSFFL